MTALTPAYDNKIYQKYSKKNLPNKAKNKVAFCQDFGLKYNKNTPLLCLSIALCDENNLSVLKEAMEGIFEQGAHLAILGVGTKDYQQYFDELHKEYSNQIAIVPDNDENKRKLYAASDIFLTTSKNTECIEAMKTGMNYGVVPICPENNTTTNYNAAKELGNAFEYSRESVWSFFAAFIRAIENYKFPYDWKLIQKNAMSAGEEGED